MLSVRYGTVRYGTERYMTVVVGTPSDRTELTFQGWLPPSIVHPPGKRIR